MTIDIVEGLGFVVVEFLRKSDDNFAGQGMSDSPATYYAPIVVSAGSTVVAEYISESARGGGASVIWFHFHSCGIFTAQ